MNPSTPSTKVTVTTVFAAVAVIALFGAQETDLLAQVPGDSIVGQALAVALAALSTFVAGYLTPETNPPESAIERINNSQAHVPYGR